MGRNPTSLEVGRLSILYGPGQGAALAGLKQKAGKDVHDSDWSFRSQGTAFLRAGRSSGDSAMECLD